MIYPGNMDTVVYRIHNINTYKIFCANIEFLRNKAKGRIRFQGYDKQPSTKEWDKAYVNISRNLYFVEPYELKKHIPSSSNYVNVKHDTQFNFAQIEFSIPKFLFANNVIECIPGLTSKFRKYGRYDSKSLVDFWLKTIKNVIQELFSDITFGAEKIDLRDVEIRRWDICYNQLFPTMEDSLFMLECMKNVRIPKGGETMFHPFDYAVTFNNPRYYFKIYHKGKEFSKNGISDLEKQLKFFQENKHEVPYFLAKSINQVPALQEYANRILRYELECKNGLMSYLFNRKIKKRFIPEYKELRTIIFYLFNPEILPFFKNYQTYYQNDLGQISNVRTRDFRYQAFILSEELQGRKGPQKTIVNDKKLQEFLFNVDHNVNVLRTKFNLTYAHKDYWKRIKILNEFLIKEDTKQSCFMLECDEIDMANVSNQKYVVKGNKELQFADILTPTPLMQKFSTILMLECIEKHIYFFDNFQFRQIPDQQKIALNVQRLNEKTKKKTDSNYNKEITYRGSYTMNQSNVILMYKALADYGGFDGLKKAGIFSRKTLYRYKKKIQELEGTNANFHYEEFTQNYCRDSKMFYKRHYEIMNNGGNVLSKFIDRKFFV